MALYTLSLYGCRGYIFRRSSAPLQIVKEVFQCSNSLDSLCNSLVNTEKKNSYKM